jgi:hypothetical protein
MSKSENYLYGVASSIYSYLGIRVKREERKNHDSFGLPKKVCGKEQEKYGVKESKL